MAWFWCWLGLAWAGEGWHPSLAEATWRRDLPSVLAAQVETDEVLQMTWSLGQFRDADALPRLQVLAGWPEEPVRQVAAFSLGLTPGAGPVLQQRLAVETSETVRHALILALGRQQEGGDDDWLVQGFLAGGLEQRASALAVGLLARRGDRRPQLVPYLIAALGGRGAPWRAAPKDAAWALAQLRLQTLEGRSLAAVQKAYARAATDEERGWLAQVLVEVLPGEERRRFVAQTLAGQGRRDRVMVLQKAQAADLDHTTVTRLADSTDPWVAAEAASWLPLVPSTLDGQLAAVRKGEDEPQALEAVQALIWGPPGALRSRAAVAWLKGGHSWQVLEEVQDESLMRLMATYVVGEPSPRGLAWVAEALGEAQDPSTQRALLDAAEAERSSLIRQNEEATRLMAERLAQQQVRAPARGPQPKARALRGVRATDWRIRLCFAPALAPAFCPVFARKLPRPARPTRARPDARAQPFLPFR